MTNKIYSIYDEKAECFNTPYFMANDAMAIRAFNDLSSDPSSTIFNNPEDFKLYELGQFENNGGLITPLSQPKFIINAQLNLKLGDQKNATPHPTTT